MIERLKKILRKLGSPKRPDQKCKICGGGMGADSVWIYNEKIGEKGELEIFCKAHGVQHIAKKLSQYNCPLWIGMPAVEKIGTRSAINFNYSMVDGFKIK